MFSRKNLIILMTVITAAVHVQRAVVDPEIRVLFALNGIGYLVLAWAYFSPQFAPRKNLIRMAYIAYTGVTIFLYLIWAVPSGELVIPLGPISKLAEIYLLVLLWQDRGS